MSPNYGGNQRPGGDAVPDWLLGGNRKRRVLAALADDRRGRGWTARELSAQLGCGVTTAHEILRSLRPLGVLTDHPRGGVVLAQSGSLARPLRELLLALAPLESTQVDRPPRSRGRT